MLGTDDNFFSWNLSRKELQRKAGDFSTLYKQNILLKYQ